MEELYYLRGMGHGSCGGVSHMGYVRVDCRWGWMCPCELRLRGVIRNAGTGLGEVTLVACVFSGGGWSYPRLGNVRLDNGYGRIGLCVPFGEFISGDFANVQVRGIALMNGTEVIGAAGEGTEGAGAFNRVMPFDSDEIHDCMEVDMGQLCTMLGMYGDDCGKLVDNEFLKCGYLSHGHILVGKNREDGLFVGVPGVYSNRGRIAASMYGFNDFKRSNKSDCRCRLFGYWCRVYPRNT
jgi:hypothetical protein